MMDRTNGRLQRILVVEDDTLLAEGLASLLTRAGHAVEQVTLAKQADSLLAGRRFDLIVLGVGKSDADGFELLRRLRERPLSPKVLVLTTRDVIEDRCYSLDLSTIGYLTKPFSISQFEGRVRKLLGRTVSLVEFWSVGDLTVDVAAKRVKVLNRSVELTPREWALLELFLAHPGRVLSKDQIAESLLPFDEKPSANAIEVHVSRLRTKIGSASTRVRTVRGFGYLWEGSNA